MQVCSTTTLFHYSFEASDTVKQSILTNGVRPLSDFPDSPRWRVLETTMPGFYQRLYDMIAASVLGKPYTNSGVFITPIDFRLLPGTYLHDKPRFKIPVERIIAEDAVMTYVIEVVTYIIKEERQSLPFSVDTHSALTQWSPQPNSGQIL